MVNKNDVLLHMSQVKAYADTLHEFPTGRDHCHVRPACYEEVGELARHYASIYWRTAGGSPETAMHQQVAQALGWLLNAYDLRGACFEDVLWQSNFYAASQLGLITEDARLPEVRREMQLLAGLSQCEASASCALLAGRTAQLAQLLQPEQLPIMCPDPKELLPWCVQTVKEFNIIRETFRQARPFIDGPVELADTVIPDLLSDIDALRVHCT